MHAARMEGEVYLLLKKQAKFSTFDFLLMEIDHHLLLILENRRATYRRKMAPLFVQWLIHKIQIDLLSQRVVAASGCSHRSTESSTESAHELGKLIASSRFAPSVKKTTLSLFFSFV